MILFTCQCQLNLPPLADSTLRIYQFKLDLRVLATLNCFGMPDRQFEGLCVNSTDFHRSFPPDTRIIPALRKRFPRTTGLRDHQICLEGPTFSLPIYRPLPNKRVGTLTPSYGRQRKAEHQKG